MQAYTKVEISVGAFVSIGVLALAYLSFTLGGLDFRTRRHYRLHARFSSVGELKVGDSVKLAGVRIGEIARVKLVDFAAEAELLLDDDVALPDDTIASVQSAGLLGDAYVSLSPGGSDRNLSSGAHILRTEPAVNITELIAKYAFGSPLEESGSDKGKHKDGDKKPRKEDTDDKGLLE
jgi:phospholipid/cholesterol/gamma-HCH transport system substrate-binding protein